MNKQNLIIVLLIVAVVVGVLNLSAPRTAAPLQSDIMLASFSGGIKQGQITYALLPGDTITITCSTRLINPSISRNQASATCRVLPATSTASAIPSVTQTATATLTPVFEVTPSSTVPPSGENFPPFALAPACLDGNGDSHPDVTDSLDYGKTSDMNLPHDLWNEVSGCHYDHEHGDDSALSDPVFGKLGEEWGGWGIDHPFHTPDEHNSFKHRAHKVTVFLANTCNSINGALNCVKNLRILHHLDFHAMATRFHSFWIEMEICKVSDPNDCGKVGRGGHLDFGPLVNQSAPGNVNGEARVAVPADANPFPLVTCGTSNRRLHNPSGINNSRFATWYGNQYPSFGCLPTAFDASGVAVGIIQIGVLSADVWSPLNLVDPLNPVVTCPDGSCGQNNSRREQGHLVAGEFTAQLDALDGAVDGYITLNGFTNTYGFIDPSCTVPGLNCVPFYFNHVPVGSYQFRFNTPKEYDVLFNGGTSGWIVYPN
jgi:hypothetical protein